MNAALLLAGLFIGILIGAVIGYLSSAAKSGSRYLTVAWALGCQTLARFRRVSTSRSPASRLTAA